MDRYRVAPARPVCLSTGAGHLRPAPPCGASGRRSGGAEIGIFTAERYFSAADVVRRDAVLRPALPDHHQHEPAQRVSVPAADTASLSGRTAASSEASWNSRSGLLSGGHSHAGSAARQKGSWGGVSSSGDRNGAGGGRKQPTSSGQRWTLFGRDCPCAGRKAVVTVAAASSKPRSPATDARFSAQSAVDECLESAIFVKAKQHPSPPPRTQVVVTEEEEPAKAAVKVTVTPGSRAFRLAANRGAAAVPPAVEAFAAAIGRRVVNGAGGSFTFPAATFASSGGALVDEPPRASLEVFRPIDEDSVMLADPPPAMPSAALRGRDPVLLRAPPAVADEEAMSDASSDLFDLESFAASSSYPTTTYRGRGSRRNSAEDDLPPYYSAVAAEPALSECMYAPSEASVVWSVATAEGGGAFDATSVANFSSAASACGGGVVEEFRFVVPDQSPAEFTAAMSRSAGRKKGGGGGGFLDSCSCEKAVSVGPTPVRVVKPPAYPAAAKMSSGGAARRQPGRVQVPVRT